MRWHHTIAALLTLIAAARNLDAGDNATTEKKPAATQRTPTALEKALAGSPEEISPDDEYLNVSVRYLLSEFGKFDVHIGAAMAAVPNFTFEQKKDFDYIRSAYRETRPAWWEKTKSTSKISFPVPIWGRTVMVNYEPVDYIGDGVNIKVVNKQLITTVRWKPGATENKHPTIGLQGHRFRIMEGHIAEFYLWHQLGHAYVTAWVPINELADAYRDIQTFSHCQEFYSDMTAIRYASPRARMLAMLMRLDLIDPPEGLGSKPDTEPTARASRAVASMLLAEFLSSPGKWPSVHFPPEVPAKDVERNAIIYAFEHLDGTWWIDEDRNLRDFAQKAMTDQGLNILRTKGYIALREGQGIALMINNDRELQPKRDAWVAQKLKMMIASGRADTKEDLKEYNELLAKAKQEVGTIPKRSPFGNPARIVLK